MPHVDPRVMLDHFVKVTKTLQDAGLEVRRKI